MQVQMHRESLQKLQGPCNSRQHTCFGMCTQFYLYVQFSDRPGIQSKHRCSLFALLSVLAPSFGFGCDFRCTNSVLTVAV